MRRTPLAVLSAAGLASLVIGTALAGPPVPTTPASETPYPSVSHAVRYATFDGHGRPVASTKWHWTPTGGNCCETYVTAANDGRLLEYGGTYPYVSRDSGKTWSQVTFATPLVNGEGAMVAGPNGDVFGIGWDPYSGDHLQGVKYTAASKKWAVAEAPLKTPFFDREWVTYAKGPFTIGGTTYPYATIVRGGGVTKAVELISGDGVSYTTVSVPGQDVTAEATRISIPVVRNPAADEWQPNPGTYTVPLNAGGVLLLNNSEDSMPCAAARLNASTAKWQCVSLPFVPSGTIRQDSRGWLTMVNQEGVSDFVLSISPDGGRTWKSTTLTPPTGGKAEASGFFDVKVNGRLGEAVVSSRFDDAGTHGQDIVWKVDVSHRQPVVQRIYNVGNGKLSSVIGVTGALADRFDFPSVALLPSGRIAVSFDDTTTPKNITRDVVPSTNPKGHSPAVAILD